MALASLYAEALDQAVSKVATAAHKTLEATAATTASGARLLLLRALDAVQRAAVDIEVAGAMLRSMFVRAVTAVLDKVAARHPRLVSADQRKVGATVSHGSPRLTTHTHTLLAADGV